MSNRKQRDQNRATAALFKTLHASVGLKRKEMDIQQHMNSLSNDEILESTEAAYKDLKLAAEESPESERHQECFAGFLCYAQECLRRGIKTVTIH